MDVQPPAVQTAAGTPTNHLHVRDTPVSRQPITAQHHSVHQAEQAAGRDAGDDVPVKPPVLRPLDRQLSEHRDVNKSVQQHSEIIA